MKKREISHWNRNQYYNNLLLFAQTLEEGLFHYSYESYKIPALNCHYLCYDLLRTAKEINSKILMDGNFVPLSEEFEQMLREDIFIKTSIFNEESLFLIKDKNGSYYDLSESDLKTKIRNYPPIASFIKDVCETKNTYLQTLLDLLLEIIFSEESNFEHNDKIYNITRMLIVELVNGGYSKEYVYITVIDFFFNPVKYIDPSVETVVNFINNFTFNSYAYQITFGINKKTSSVLGNLKDVQVREATASERKALNLQRADDNVAEISAKLIDEYSVFERSLMDINTILGLHRINQHESKLFITPRVIVKTVDSEGKEKKKLLNQPISPMRKKGNSSDLHALFNDIALINTIGAPNAFFRAVALHNGAMESKDISNQLLNLWTAVEVLIDTKRDNEDRINTICGVLCSVLNRCYLYSQLEQLLSDIKGCSDSDIDTILMKISYEQSEIDLVERLAIILSVSDFEKELAELISLVAEYPLIKHRIEFFAKHVFKDSQSIYGYIKRHEQRVRWHIMRIYRNRNMIVHSGSYMPYRNVIIENLHFYVDVLLDTLIEYYHIGLLNHTSIYKNISGEETGHYLKLGVSLKSKKQKNNNIGITLDNSLSLILNNYSGNFIKKALNEVAKNNAEAHFLPSRNNLLKIPPLEENGVIS